MSAIARAGCVAPAASPALRRPPDFAIASATGQPAAGGHLARAAAEPAAAPTAIDPPGTAEAGGDARETAPPKPEKREKPPVAAKTWTQAVRQHLQKLDDRGQFYPQEAIARGLEGEVLVLIIIGEEGQVTAARVEQGSGHRILDDAALRAVRSLRSLPADAPREALLPVRFRLR